MARTIVDSNLKDRTGRGRLKARRKPYWREIEPSLAVGYRKLKNPICVSQVFWPDLLSRKLS
jgi:hypothetical protein